jgi:hypothetical protein
MGAYISKHKRDQKLQQCRKNVVYIYLSSLALQTWRGYIWARGHTCTLSCIAPQTRWGYFLDPWTQAYLVYCSPNVAGVYFGPWTDAYFVYCSPNVAGGITNYFGPLDTDGTLFIIAPDDCDFVAAVHCELVDVPQSVSSSHK